jgi:pyruvate dehydrogenase E1 component beta subunit
MTGENARCVASDLARIPGLKAVQPATACSARALLQAAIRDPGPVAVLEDEQLYPMCDAGADASVADLGVARVAREGADLTIAAAGHGLVLALAAAIALARQGIEAEVIDLMCVRPLDRETVAASVSRTGRLMTVEECSADGGIGSELVASIASRSFRDLKTAPLRISAAGVPMPYVAELQAAARPTTERIVHAAIALVRGT